MSRHRKKTSVLLQGVGAVGTFCERGCRRHAGGVAVSGLPGSLRHEHDQLTGRQAAIPQQGTRLLHGGCPFPFALRAVREVD